MFSLDRAELSIWGIFRPLSVVFTLVEAVVQSRASGGSSGTSTVKLQPSLCLSLLYLTSQEPARSQPGASQEISQEPGVRSEMPEAPRPQAVGSAIVTQSVGEIPLIKYQTETLQ